MATTTNYGWTTPDDTDLVKDGAAAIRTLGTSIDTSFAADEGDLLVGGTNDIFEALPIGAAGTVLTSDGDTAEWVAPTGSSGPAFRAFRNTSTQAMVTNTWTKVQFNAETFDTGSFFDSTTNYRFTPTTAGYYQINLNVYHSLTGNPAFILCAIYLNGASYSKHEVMLNGQNFGSTAVTDIVYLNGSSDYVEGYALQNNASTLTNGSDLTNFSGTWIRS
jgi:hypothetical protein